MQLRDDPLCVTKEGVRTWGDFAADVAAFRLRIRDATHVCNLFHNRYDFMVGIAAAMLNGQVTVLPSAAASGSIAAAQKDTRRPVLLGSAAHPLASGWRIDHIIRSDRVGDPAALVKGLKDSAGEIHVFTSGSTGLPMRHIKDWRALAGGATLTEAILRDMSCCAGSCVIIGTTPHQHMYGLEASVFAGLAFGYCLYGGTVFFPADLERAVVDVGEAGFQRIVLVSSPAHLKFLESTVLSTPAICGVVSATAPLSAAQAERLEARGDLSVIEIYGSTETGSLARRRTVERDEWRVLEGFVLKESPGGVVATAPHLRAPVQLPDAIELTSESGFQLLGRLGDMVCVAGKRTTLASLNTILAEVPGILDGVVLHRPSGDGDALAVVAVVDRGCWVTDTKAKAAIRRGFIQHVDPVFLPKRICFVNHLPRSETGKIPADALESLIVDVGLSIGVED